MTKTTPPAETAKSRLLNEIDSLFKKYFSLDNPSYFMAQFKADVMKAVYAAFENQSLTGLKEAVEAEIEKAGIFLADDAYTAGSVAAYKYILKLIEEREQAPPVGYVKRVPKRAFDEVIPDGEI